MQTILSRVRTYNFMERPLPVQKEVIQRVFHNDYFSGEISEYLLTYLPVPATKLRENAKAFVKGIFHNNIPDCDTVVKENQQFEPRVELKIFLNGIAQTFRPLMNTQAGSEACAEAVKVLRECYENVTLYNQSVKAALEVLIRDLNKINVMYGRIFAGI